MARKRVVSRTFKVMQVTALCINPQTGETFDNVFEISYIKNLKVKDIPETPTMKAVYIKSTEVYEKHMAMDEETFMELAYVIPDKDEDNPESNDEQTPDTEPAKPKKKKKSE